MEDKLKEAAKAYVKKLPGINYRSLYDFGTQQAHAFEMGAKWQQQSSVDLEGLEDEKLLHFINWFGTWSTEKHLPDYGISDIQYAYRKEFPIVAPLIKGSEWISVEDNFSFKVINNNYLLKNNE